MKRKGKNDQNQQKYEDMYLTSRFLIDENKEKCNEHPFSITAVRGKRRTSMIDFWLV